MNIAQCTLDNTIYAANDFSAVADFANKKRYLICTECGGPAFYRGPTRNGREACFGARPHTEDCTLATLDNEGTPNGQDAGEVLTTGQRIVVDFNHGTPTGTVVEQPLGRPLVAGAVRCRIDGGATTREIISRRMSSLLRSLIESDDFRTSQQIIEITGQGEHSIADLFVSFSDITDAHVGTYHGYWGMIPDARIGMNGTLWFNSGGREDISILLAQAHLGAAYQRFHIDDEEDIAGSYILVFGELNLSTRGKKYVQVTESSRFVLRLAR